MHFHLPEPLHGWREFAGEVGIIVLGVLLALGAQQAASTLQWRSQVRDFRASLDTEIDFDLAAYQYRLKQSPCIERRLAELQRWSAEQRAGHAHRLLGEIGYPSRIAFESSVWNSRGSDLTGHIAPDARLTYAGLYDSFANQWNFLQSERDAWLRLNGFNHATNLSADNLIQLDELIYRAGMLNGVLLADVKWFKAAQSSLGVRPSFGSLSRNVGQTNPPLCRRILPPPAPVTPV